MSRYYISMTMLPHSFYLASMDNYAFTTLEEACRNNDKMNCLAATNKISALAPFFYIPLEDVTHPIFSLTLSLYKLNNAVNDTLLKQQQIRGHLPSPLRHSGLQLYFVAALPKCFHGPTQLGVHSP
ncbi:hypothetical protein BDA99DRAFT_530998 [Phascolomyces articulosus]|uniref:Uncharacterized protein n=1 Tax=Phascolomyces articulosus TaxID=60185 RepID=A0AAD5KPK2_9FUNG|nr:hypothetical protein BDA99DRAFT_530998 [Phascolomyces articulosus]